MNRSTKKPDVFRTEKDIPQWTTKVENVPKSAENVPDSEICKKLYSNISIRYIIIKTDKFLIFWFFIVK